jgi:hypothetical protein
MKRPAILASGLVAAAVWATGTVGAADRDAAMTITGAVSDASGAPVAAATVRVLKTRRVRVLGSQTGADQAVEEARVRTDAEGRYTVDVPIDNAFPFWFVRFYDPKSFDGVKYRLPDDVDISRRVLAGATIEAKAVLQFHPDWPKVRGLVDQYGAASRRGQILRSLGLPARRAPGGEGRETWEFPAAGVAYLLEGDRVIETRRFDPTKPGENPEAVPAERTDKP